MVERPLWRREVPGSNPTGSNFTMSRLPGLEAIFIVLPPLGMIDVHIQCPNKLIKSIR